MWTRFQALSLEWYHGAAKTTREAAKNVEVMSGEALERFHVMANELGENIKIWAAKASVETSLLLKWLIEMGSTLLDKISRMDLDWAADIVHLANQAKSNFTMVVHSALPVDMRAHDEIISNLLFFGLPAFLVSFLLTKLSRWLTMLILSLVFPATASMALSKNNHNNKNNNNNNHKTRRTETGQSSSADSTLPASSRNVNVVIRDLATAADDDGDMYDLAEDRGSSESPTASAEIEDNNGVEPE